MAKQYLVCGDPHYQTIIQRELLAADPASIVTFRINFRAESHRPGTCVIVALGASESSITDANLVLGAASEWLPAAVIVFSRDAAASVQQPRNEYGRVFRDVHDFVKWSDVALANAA